MLQTLPYRSKLSLALALALIIVVVAVIATVSCLKKPQKRRVIDRVPMLFHNLILGNLEPSRQDLPPEKI